MSLHICDGTECGKRHGPQPSLGRREGANFNPGLLRHRDLSEKRVHRCLVRNAATASSRSNVTGRQLHVFEGAPEIGFRRASPPIIPNPAIIIAQAVGSGTALVESGVRSKACPTPL